MKMNYKSMVYKILAVIMVIAFLVGCSQKLAASVPTTTPAVVAPTENVASTLEQIRTQAAQTVVAQMTQNAPSATPVSPTSTATQIIPTVTMTSAPLLPTAAYPTATWIPWTITPAYSPTHVYSPTPIGYACKLISHYPMSADTIKVNTPFTANWVVKNTGTLAWDQHAVDFVFVSGHKMKASANRYDLTATVAAGAKYTAKVDLIAPPTAGAYTATWALVQYDLTICTLDITVTAIK
jgi:hypothetical protein